MILLLTILFQTNVYALEGVDYIKFLIDGKEYDVPIPNKETREDFRYLRMVLDGDEIAREFLLGGKQERFIFIGDVGVVRWVKLTKNDVSVIEY